MRRAEIFAIATAVITAECWIIYLFLDKLESHRKRLTHNRWIV
jgi:hypothetical protein